MAKTKTLENLFLDTLKDIYYAEKKILKALPKMARAAQDEKLRAGFEKHMRQTETQIERLAKVFKSIGETARGKKCEAIEGILEEGNTILDEYQDSACPGCRTDLCGTGRGTL